MGEFKGFGAGEFAETAVEADGGQNPCESLTDRYRVAAGDGRRIGAPGAVRERARGGVGPGGWGRGAGGSAMPLDETRRACGRPAGDRSPGRRFGPRAHGGPGQLPAMLPGTAAPRLLLPEIVVSWTNRRPARRGWTYPAIGHR